MAGHERLDLVYGGVVDVAVFDSVLHSSLDVERAIVHATETQRHSLISAPATMYYSCYCMKHHDLRCTGSIENSQYK